LVSGRAPVSTLHGHRQAGDRLLVIIVGAFYVNPANWKPFAPYGFTGIAFFGKTIFGQTGMGGEAARDAGGRGGDLLRLHRLRLGLDARGGGQKPEARRAIGIITSLVLCTVTVHRRRGGDHGHGPYNQINIDAPVSDAFRQAGLPWARFLISVGALTGITSVLLVMMLEPAAHLPGHGARRPACRPASSARCTIASATPWKATILTGVFVATLAALVPLRILADLVNIGTLLASSWSAPPS